MLARLVKSGFGRKLTIMLIPHGSIKPLRVSFSASVLLLGLLAWTGLTVSAGYLYSQHIDYYRMKADHNLMKLKVTFFAKEIQRSHEMLEQVKENDQQLRTLLGMKSKKAIIEDQGRGGPSPADQHNLYLLMNDTLHELTPEDIARQTAVLQQETQKRIQSYNEICTTIENERSLYNCTPNIWPCRGHLTSTFGYRIHPIYQTNEFHAGLDIANTRGTPILATGDGTVKLATWTQGYGRLVVIDHGHGYSSFYGHADKLMVRAGDHVRRGQVVSHMGNTGTSTGNHVHYEIRFKGRPVNPAQYLKKDAGAQLAHHR